MECGEPLRGKLPPLSDNPYSNGRKFPKNSFSSNAHYTVKGVAPSFPESASVPRARNIPAGDLETWPAHALNQSVSQDEVLKFLNRPGHATKGNGARVHIAKPRLLEFLENFLEKELRVLSNCSVDIHEERLQAHREVFEYLIAEFKTYRPLLAAIKNEYEMTLSYYREEIRSLEPLKQMLVTVSEQCEKKIIDLQKIEKEDITALKNDNSKLWKKIREMHNKEASLLVERNQLTEQLAVAYRDYRDKADSCRLLISDINDLRFRQDDIFDNENKTEDGADEEKEDPVYLKIALKQAREDLSTAIGRLSVMEADYADVVPRRDFLAAEKKIEELTEQVESLKRDGVDMQNELDVALANQQRTQEERDEFSVKFQHLERSATPRPDWSIFSSFAECSNHEWSELTSNMKSKDIASLICRHLNSGDDISGKESLPVFEGLGNSEDVPSYLRGEGQFKNRKFSKRNSILLIRDIWNEKRIFDDVNSPKERISLSDFVHKYLMEKYPHGDMALEWAYNLKDSCIRYHKNEQVSLFSRILNDEYDEELFHKQCLLKSAIVSELSEKASAADRDTVTSEEFKETMLTQCPWKDSQSVDALLEAVVKELTLESSANINFRHIFAEDEEGKGAEFLELFERQNETERTQFLQELVDKIGPGEATINSLKAALNEVDSSVNAHEADHLIKFVFSSGSSQPENFVQRIMKCQMFRSSPPPKVI